MRLFPPKIKTTKNNKKTKENKRKKQKAKQQVKNKEKKQKQQRKKKSWKPILENVPKLTNILLSYVQLRDFWTKENSKVQLAFESISFGQKSKRKFFFAFTEDRTHTIIDQKSSALPTELLEHDLFDTPMITIL